MAAEARAVQAIELSKRFGGSLGAVLALDRVDDAVECAIPAAAVT
jgi:hypothetical protein